MVKERGWRHHQSQTQKRVGLEMSLGASRWSWTSCPQPGEWFCPGLLSVMSSLCSLPCLIPDIPRTTFPPCCISGKQHFCQAVPGPASSPPALHILLPAPGPHFSSHRTQHLSASGHMDPVDRNQFSSDNHCGKTSTRLQG